MGNLPTSPKIAAKEASSSLQQAISTYEGIKNVFFIDFLLPSYDVFDENMYDAMSVLDFCMELSKNLEGKVDIVVRDGEGW